MKAKTKEMLFAAWAYCDEEDKSTEFMFQFMADSAGVDYDRAVQFVIETTEEERQAWYDGDSKMFFLSYSHDGKNQGCINVKAHCPQGAMVKVKELYPSLIQDDIAIYSVLEFDLEENKLYSPEEVLALGHERIKNPKLL